MLKTAGRLFRRNTYLGTNIEEIARALNINWTMIYYYFGSKAELLYSFLANAIDELTEEFQIIIRQNASILAQLKAIVELHMKYETSPDSLAGVAVFEIKILSGKFLKSYIRKRDKYELVIRDLLQKGISEGYVHKGDTRMMCRVILGLINSVPI